MPTERRLAAIMFTDIVGYTALMARDEEAARRARDRHEAVVRPLVERYGGEWIERTGDETVSSFPSALDAVNCSLAAQAELDGDANLQLRIGIHQGDVTFDEGGVSGDGVNLAARVRPMAQPGGICISGDVHHSVRGRVGLEFESLGEQDFKNVDHPVAVFAVSGTAESPRPASGESRPGARRGAGWVAAAVLLIAASAGWWMYRPASDLAPIRSIAVLPLENLSGDPEQEYFSDGMTEAVTSELARISSLKVISRTSVMRYKNAAKPLREIAGELDVEGIIEGSVLRAGDRVRITLQLIDARTDHHVWAENYERDLRDVLALQREVATAVAGSVSAELSPAQRSTAKIDPRALDAYLRGVHYLSADDLERAAESFELATRIEPDYARAYGALSRVYTRRMWLGSANLEDWSEGAEQAARRALEIDETVGVARTSLATVLWVRDFDWETAGREYRRAVELDPGEPMSLALLTWYLALSGRHEESIANQQRLFELAPFEPAFRGGWFLNVLFMAREFDRAIEEGNRFLVDHPSGPGDAHFWLGETYLEVGEFEKGVRAYLQAVRERGNDSLARTVEAGWDEGGINGAYRRVLEWGEANGDPSPDYVVILCARLKDADCAFEAFDRAYERRVGGILTFGVDPRMDPLRSDPRFDDLLRRIGFPEN